MDERPVTFAQSGRPTVTTRSMKVRWFPRRAAPWRLPSPSDLLPIIRNSGVLTEKQFLDVRSKVVAGDYPGDSKALAQRLVRDGVLTEYQTRRFLGGKSHGLLVGKYVILDRLGSGSMGRVYKAHHQLMGRVVALKIIAPEIVTNERVVARFQREMRLVGKLDHPNVVRAFDADQAGGILYIVMEYVAGQSLGPEAQGRARSRRSRPWATRRRPPSAWPTPTRRGSSTATSSPRTSCSTRRSRSRCSTWAWAS